MARRKQRRVRRLAASIEASLKSVHRTIVGAIAGVARQLRPHGPVVIVDGPAQSARRLRRAVTQATVTFAASLGASPPAGLVIVVQRVAHEGRDLNGSLKTFEISGSKRHLLQLASTVNGRQVSEEELLVALRDGLTRVLADFIGEPVQTAAIELDLPRARQAAPVIALRANGSQPPPEPDRSAIPIQRIDNNNHA